MFSRLATTAALALTLLIPGVSFAATPTIANVSGTVATGQTLTVTGASMMDEDKTSWEATDLNFLGSAYGFEGPSPAADGYGIGAGFDASGDGSVADYSSSVKISGSKSARFHIQGEHFCNQDHDNPECNPRASAYIWNYYAPPTNIWLREYVRYDWSGGWPTQWLKHWWMQGEGSVLYVQPQAGTAPSDGFSYGDTGFGLWENTAEVPGGITDGRWYCLEGHFQTVNGHVQATAYVDGVAAPTIITESPSIIMQWLEFGIINLNATSVGFSIDNYVDNFVYSRTTRIGCSSMLEIADSSNYATATKKYQEPVFLSDTSAQVKADLTGLGAGPYYLFVTNNRGARSAGHLLGEIDTTPPASPAGLGVQ